jgi:triacylglycerol lipase
MLQLILIAALIVEIFVYVVFGMYWRNRGFEWLVILPALGVIAVGLRLLMALPSFMLSGAFRIRDNQQQPWGNALYALAKEIDARAVTLNFSEIFHQLLMRSEPIGPATGTPILLVHGYFSNRGMWWRFRKRVANAGLGPIHTITLSPLWGSIDELVPQLAAKIEAICTHTGHEKLIVIAHSMGGLATRAYMTSNVNGSSKIAKFITLATPHQGTQMANFGIGQCVSEMQMKSGWLAALERGEENIPHPPTLSIYTLNDDLVYPPENSRLAWAENIPVAAIGHVGLLFSKVIAERVIAEIKK